MHYKEYSQVNTVYIASQKLKFTHSALILYHCIIITYHYKFYGEIKLSYKAVEVVLQELVFSLFQYCLEVE